MNHEGVAKDVFDNVLIIFDGGTAKILVALHDAVCLVVVF